MLNLFCKKEGGRGARAVWIIKNFWAAPPPPPFGQCLKENIFPRGVTNTLWYTSIYFGIPQRWTVSLPYKDLFSRWLSIFFSQENLVTHGQRHNFPHQYQHFDHMVIYPTMIWWHGWCWVLLSFFWENVHSVKPLIWSVAGQNIQIRSEMAPSIHHHYTSLGVTWRIGKHILIYENETSE